jgi:hypothetical protein
VKKRDNTASRGNPAGAVAVHEPLMEIGADDAEPGAEIEDVPAVGSEQADRRWDFDSARAQALATGQRPVLVGQQVDERRLPGPVRSDDGGVPAGPDRQAHAVEHGGAILHHRRIDQLENRRPSRQWPPE